jgi:hypothetical protein
LNFENLGEKYCKLFSISRSFPSTSFFDSLGCLLKVAWAPWVQVPNGRRPCSWGSEMGSRSLQATQAPGTPGEMQRREGLLVLLLWERGSGSFWAGQVRCLGRLLPPPRPASPPCALQLGSRQRLKLSSDRLVFFRLPAGRLRESPLGPLPP